jgi:hypothetical protein
MITTHLASPLTLLSLLPFLLLLSSPRTPSPFHLISLPSTASASANHRPPHYPGARHKTHPSTEITRKSNKAMSSQVKASQGKSSQGTLLFRTLHHQRAKTSTPKTKNRIYKNESRFSRPLSTPDLHRPTVKSHRQRLHLSKHDNFAHVRAHFHAPPRAPALHCRLAPRGDKRR